VSDGNNERPKRFGRALRLSAKKRRLERLYDLAYTGGWPSWIARPIGLQGRLRLSTHQFEVTSAVPLPPLRVAFISDLHGGPGTHPATIRKACRVVAEARPDLLLLGGDFVSFHARHVEGVLEGIDSIYAPLGRFAVLGNHDLIADDAYLVDRLASIGVKTLINENVRLDDPYESVWVCGLDNTEQGSPDGAKAVAGATGLRFVLMHSPDGLTALGGEPFAIAFTGHVHGGQFVLPGGVALIGTKGPLSQRYLYGGVFELGAPGERILLVSRGIGQGSLPMRFRADPEVHICDLSFRASGASRGIAVLPVES
jgi:predicted MPP superfamily phosphohydrolase